MATATTGALSISRVATRRRIADAFGDLVQLVATSNSGNATTFVDSANINAGTEHFTGREIHFTSGTNNGLTRRITSTTEASNLVTFAAVTASTATSDTADVYNKRATGFTKAEYDRWINYAIEASAGYGNVHVVSTVATPALFDADSPTFTVPASLREVYKVEWQDDNSLWHEVRKAPRWGGEGWFAEAPNGYIRITGRTADLIDGYALRVWGYGRQETCSADSDTIALDPEWLTAWVCYHMARANLDRKPELAGVVMLLENDERRDASRLRVLRVAGATVVRA